MTEAEATASTSDLDQLREALTNAKKKFMRLDSPTQELQLLSEAIRNAAKTDRMATDEAFATWINEEAAISMMQKLAKATSRDPAYVDAIADTLEAFMDLFAHELKAKRYHETYTCAMTWAFQPETSLHKAHFQMSDDDLKRLTTSRQTWRNDLVVGAKVDVNSVADAKEKTKGWLQGTIERVEGDLLSVVFPELPVEFDRDIDRWSTDVAQFETRTKEDYEWRRSSMGAPSDAGYVADVHDLYKWEEATLFRVYAANSGGRSVLMGDIGFRVYREVGLKLRTDDQGRTYDGWSERYDEHIPCFSPRIQPHLSRVKGAVVADDDLDEDLDDVIGPEEGHDRVFAVPRLSSCISSKFIGFMNRFGHTGGFNAILDTLKNETAEKATLTTMGYLITMISMPSRLFHRDWLAEFAEPFTTAMKKQLLSSPDSALKGVTANDVGQIQTSISSINQRVMDKPQAREEQEKLKLEVCKKCLASELLERRILGIKELNTIIRNTQMVTYGSAKVFTLEWLISWMSEHGVFDIIWDTKRTHLQLVQRSNEIFKILPKENLLSMALLEQFWTLSKSDYKSEVFKIINDTSFYLNQEHVEYLFNEITQTPASKLGMEEFEALSGLGKFSRDPAFQAKTVDFFWRIITDSDGHKADLIESCIGKFAEMIKLRAMDKKQPCFNMLVDELKSSRSSAVPVIRLFKKIIKDQKSKGSYTGNYQTGNTTVAVHNSNATSGWGQTTGAQGDIDEEDKTADTEGDKEVTLLSVLNSLWQDQGMIEALLGNLDAYSKAAAQKVTQDPSKLNNDRTKMFLLSPKYSHQEELNERLSFLQEFAVNSDFQISKAQLSVIYDLLSQSPIQSDFSEFLNWCNTACKAQTAASTVLDLEEVGEFFSELIKTKKLNLKALPNVGFQFLTSYFTSQNIAQQKLLKIASAEKKKAATSWTGGYYGTSSYGNDKADDDAVEPQDDDATFQVTVDPSLLTKIDMIWEIALESQVEDVIYKSIAFLVNCYLSVSDALEERRTEILQSLNARCFELIAANRDDPTQIKRLVRILEAVIQISEKKGTGDVQPHNAILKGEMLDRVIIRYMVKNKASYYGGLKLDKTVVVKLYTSATVWEFKKEVSSMLGLAPKYIKLTLPNKDQLMNNMHGLTMQELGLKNGDILTAEKLSVSEHVTEAPLVDPATRQLVPRAVEIFTEWFHIYVDPVEGKMAAPQVAKFIAGATRATCSSNDPRVTTITTKYGGEEAKLGLADFLSFYRDAASGTTLKAVQSNLKNHNVRLDLKKMSEVVDEVSYSATEMPRYTLSANQEQFQALFSLLDRNDEASQDVWELVRMLATNQQMYQEVLSLSQAESDEGINWASVFEDASLFKQIYKQEIIVAVMEASKAGGDDKRVMFVEEQKLGIAAPTFGGQSGQEEDKEEETEDSTQATSTTEEGEAALKANWTKKFLEHEGFSFVLDHFLAKQISTSTAATFSEQASLKDVAFLTTLLRVFLQAGFNAQEGGAIGNALSFVRQSSSINKASSIPDNKPKGEDHLEKLMKSPEGMDIMLNTDFEELFGRVLDILAQTLSKTSFIVEDKVIIENALNIVVGTFIFKKELFAKFINYKSTASGTVKNAEDLVLAGLLCAEEKVRVDFERSLRVLAINLQGEDQNLLYFFLGVLARNFGTIQNRPSRQFFELFNKLIDQKAVRDELLDEEAALKSAAIYDPEDLLSQIIDKIKQQQRHKQEAAAAGEKDDDEVQALELAAEQERLLVGLITLTGKIIAKADKSVSDRIIQEKDLIGQIFKEFLFAGYYEARNESSANSDAIVLQQQIGSRNDTKKAAAPNNKSREAAYELLHQLIKNSTTLMKTFLESQLVPLIKTIKKPKTWNYLPATASGDRFQKYVGLRNLGCICYMNSMMQQFFMVPAFRYNLMCVDDGKAEEMKEYKGDQIDDNMMHQLQKLIAHLELSDRNDYNPKEFCFSFKEFDGSPTNTAEQKDAQEFLNVIFDRVENSLKETTRKHLIQGIFGGKQCSQMVCTECGKVKNRMEDYLNLSIPIKGFKSVEESLAKQIEGEIISDYQCSGCNRKVDLQKRSMIASTPNILIVHLQRICFNFDTFQNDKINSFCSFPNVLDLKPYSFHEVMGKENRLKEQQPEEEISLSEMQQQQQRENEMTEEELEAKKEAVQDAMEPERDDCYEYKLVGVNVHSGTANAGHYWSYINTNRGTDEKEGDTEWIKAEADPWMEYNDSRVSDFEFKDLSGRTFGNQNKGGASSGVGGYFSSMGDSYGTSAYMLFYERRQKKDLKIIVPTDQVEQKKAAGVDVQYDEEKKENFEMKAYRSAADGELAGDIYKKVAEDNAKFSFEGDIYSSEFFDFILQILQSIAESEVDSETKLNGLNIGSKVGFEVLARMAINTGIEKVSDVMIEILKSRPEITKPFIYALCNEENAENFWQVLLEAPDKNAQNQLARVLKYALCQLKSEEKASAMAKETETVTRTYTIEEGKTQDLEIQIPKPACIRFLTLMTEQLSTRAAKNWRKMDAFLEIFHDFMIYSAEDIEKETLVPDFDSDAYKTGVEFYFLYDMVRYLGDFILQENSPYYESSQMRISMGGTYQNPNFSKILKTIIMMISDAPMMEKYPLNDLNQAVVSHKNIIQQMIEPAEGSNTDFTSLLLNMAKNNVKISKKMAKTYLKNSAKPGPDAPAQALQQIAEYLKIEDSLKQQRMEWVFGIPQLLSKPNFRNRVQQYGLELLDVISDVYYDFKPGCIKGIMDSFLGQLYKNKGRMENNCLTGLKALIQMCIDDDDVARYIWNQPAPSLQYARYSDWFFPYVEALNLTTQAATKNTSTLLDFHKNRLDACAGILAMQEGLDAKFAPLRQEQMTQLENLGAKGFAGYSEQALHSQVSEVIPSFPPVYIVGPTTPESNKVILTEDCELATVTLEEVSADYMYSNPQGLFNLSCPEKMWRNPTSYQQQSYTSWKTTQLRQGAPVGTEVDTSQIIVKNWNADKQNDATILRVMFKSKAAKMIRVGVTLSVEDNENKNVVFPETELKENLFSNDQKQAFVFLKIDPSKNTWGDIKIQISASLGKTSQISTGGYSNVGNGMIMISQ